MPLAAPPGEPHDARTKLVSPKLGEPHARIRTAKSVRNLLARIPVDAGMRRSRGDTGGEELSAFERKVSKTFLKMVLFQKVENKLRFYYLLPPRRKANVYRAWITERVVSRRNLVPFYGYRIMSNARFVPPCSSGGLKVRLRQKVLINHLVALMDYYVALCAWWLISRFSIQAQRIARAGSAWAKCNESSRNALLSQLSC